MPGLLEGFALSPLQLQAWRRQEQSAGRFQGTGAVISLSGVSDVNRVAAALSQIVARHEILRTTLSLKAGAAEPVQAVLEVADCRLQAAELPDRESESALSTAAFLDDQMDRSWSALDQAPMHAVLSSTRAETSLLVVTLPAWNADPGTMIRIYRELAGLLDGSDTSTAEQPLQYADLATWQSTLQTVDTAPSAARFWRQQASAIAFSEANHRERPVASGDSWTRDVYRDFLPAEARTAANQLAAELGASLTEVLLASWQILLWRVFRRRSVVIGIPFDLSVRHGLEDCLGPFTTDFPVDFPIAETATFREVLANTRAKLAMAARHSDVFAGEHLPEGPARAPFGFELIELPDAVQAGGGTLRLDSVQTRSQPYRLKLACLERSDALVMEWQYDRFVVSPAEIRRFSERLPTLLTQLQGRFDEPITALAIVGPQESHDILELLSGDSRIAGEPVSIVELIDLQARAAPERIAIQSESGQISYGELVRRANGIAERLVALGAGPDARVGIHAEREIETVIGMLGALKSRAAYVPLDPSYPLERNQHTVRDAGLHCLLTRSPTQASALELASGAACLLLDQWESTTTNEMTPGDRQQSAEGGNSRLGEVDQESEGREIAYLVYTSGTTGHPKGTLLTRRNLAHSVRALRTTLSITEDDVYLHTAAMGFSSAMRQWFVPLASGARVVVASERERRDPIALFELIREKCVTVVDLVPSHWRSCLNALGQLEPDVRHSLLANHLRLCLSASEPLASDIPHTWMVQWKHPARFINMFGHTETCGIVSAYPVPTGGSLASSIVPLGRPLPNMRTYLLNASNALAAWGEPGEVCVAGPGVGAGFLNLDEFTARQFPSHSFCGNSDDRMYRTGDLARFLPDGNLEFLSRRDNQVKLRGHRVELADVEAHLAGHAAVAHCAVNVNGRHEDDRHLVGFVVPTQSPGPGADELRRHLSSRLPVHMVPSVFIFLPALPTTPTGKLDRKALAGIAESAAAVSTAQPLSSPVEAALLDIWAEVLGTRNFGVNDDFVALGGHSLMAMRIVTRIRQTFRAPVTLRTLFDTPTVAALAQALIACELRPGLTEKVARILIRTDEAIPREITDGKNH